MKILQLFCRYQEIGGEEVAVTSIGRHLRRRHEVEDLIFDNASLARFTGLRKAAVPFLFFLNPESCRLFESRRMAFRPDLIIVHNLFPAGSAALLAKVVNCGVPAVYYAHNFRPFSVNGYCWAGGRLEPAGLRLNFWPEIRLASWQQSRTKTALFAAVLYALHFGGIWKKVPAWIAISDFVRDRFVDAGIPPDKIHTLYNPCELKSRPDSGNSGVPSGIPSDPVPLFLFLGRLSEEKGLLILLEAWAAYRRRGGEGSLVVAGTGPLLEALKSATPPNAGVRFSGQVSGTEKASLLANCTALVVPSLWWEGFGLVVYEAYEYGKPVLAAASGGLRENVLHGQTGWVHPPGDAETLADHFMDAASQAEECRIRGAKGRELLEVLGSVERYLDRFEEIVTPLMTARENSAIA